LFDKAEFLTKLELKKRLKAHFIGAFDVLSINVLLYLDFQLY